MGLDGNDGEDSFRKKHNLRTYCLEILRAVRSGLHLRDEAFKGVIYTADSLVCWFRYSDGKLYQIEIKERKEEKL